MNERSDEVTSAAEFIKSLVPHLRPRLAHPDIATEVRQAAERILDAIDARAPETLALLWASDQTFRDDQIVLSRRLNAVRTSMERELPDVDAVARVAALNSAVLDLHQAIRAGMPFHAQHHVSTCWCWLVTAVDTDLPVFAVSGSTSYSEAIRRKAETAFAGRGLTGIWGIDSSDGSTWKLYHRERCIRLWGGEPPQDFPPDFRDDIVHRGDSMWGQWMLASEPEPGDTAQP